MYVYMKAMKWVANPYLFEQAPGAFVESNVTTLTFFDGNFSHINITLNSGKSVEIREPWNKTQAYESELLGCMYWNDS